MEILYLNPIFYAWSTHRYDTCDYKRIDPMLGTEEDFRALCAEAHAHGMKVILDGVFRDVYKRQGAERHGRRFELGRPGPEIHGAVPERLRPVTKRYLRQKKDNKDQ